MLSTLLRPKVDLAALTLRWGLAAIFIVHGYFKISQPYALTHEMSLTVQMIVGWTEFISGLALAIGLLSRIAALANIPIQVGAIILVTGKYAMVVTPIGARGADYTRVGPEYNLMLIVTCIGVVLLGSGALSVDYVLRVMMRSKSAEPAREPVGAAH